MYARFSSTPARAVLSQTPLASRGRSLRGPRFRASAVAKLLLLLALGLALPARAQLAITEIMSSAATNLGPAVVVQPSDFWELTNFGTNTVDLTGYKWNDNGGGLLAADPLPFQGLSIGPNESIIFMESNSSSAVGGTFPPRNR